MNVVLPQDTPILKSAIRTWRKREIVRWDTSSTNFHVVKCWVVAELRKVWDAYYSIVFCKT